MNDLRFIIQQMAVADFNDWLVEMLKSSVKEKCVNSVVSVRSRPEAKRDRSVYRLFARQPLTDSMKIGVPRNARQCLNRSNLHSTSIDSVLLRGYHDSYLVQFLE